MNGDGDVGDSGEDSGAGLVGCRSPRRPDGEREKVTHLLMYSPVRMTLQVWHLKQLTCHCLSSARSDWPCLISSLHPAQSEKTKGRTSWVWPSSPAKGTCIPGYHFIPHPGAACTQRPCQAGRKVARALACGQRTIECWEGKCCPAAYHDRHFCKLMLSFITLEPVIFASSRSLNIHYCSPHLENGTLPRPLHGKI
jgi:hypothetical protein